MITVTPLPAFQDNYLWLLHRGRAAAVVDPGDGEVVRAALDERGLELAAILITHHHADHVGGLPLLLRHWNVPVYGPRAEAAKIPGLSRLLEDGDRVDLPELGVSFEVLAVPGHTLGHIAYHAPAQKLLFCGDTLFAGGCGRLFEGTPQQMYASLERLAGLEGDTRVYCAHEYTLSNLDFARAVEPDSAAVAAEIERVRALRARQLPSVPSTVARERSINPFLRAGLPVLARSAAAHAGKPLPDAVEVFAELRRWKDGYKSSLR
ncbi:MAG TPA: hydroxyacylglutathione hydrolase [Nevskia sp.]|jgi:hydroxyacylglutathione hydrolase|nr:hydroxyacylglutathione hydrolase [Nevskia sp.]